MDALALLRQQQKLSNICQSPLHTLAEQTIESPSINTFSTTYLSLTPGLNHVIDSPPRVPSSPSVLTINSKRFRMDEENAPSQRMELLVQVAECTEEKQLLKKKRLPPNPEKKSAYRGVSWQKTSKAWVGQFKSNGKTTYLGLYADEKEAAKAYDIGLYLKGNVNPSMLNFGVPTEEELNLFRSNNQQAAGRLGATLSKRGGDLGRRVTTAADSNDGHNVSTNDEDGNGGKQLERCATSHYRGVSWYAARQIWKASIQVDRKKEYIGRFETEEEAARAYNKRATELKGPEAVLNQVPDTVTRCPLGEEPMLLSKQHQKRVSKKRPSLEVSQQAPTAALPPPPPPPPPPPSLSMPVFGTPSRNLIRFTETPLQVSEMYMQTPPPQNFLSPQDVQPIPLTNTLFTSTSRRRYQSSVNSASFTPLMQEVMANDSPMSSSEFNFAQTPSSRTDNFRLRTPFS